MHASKPLQNSFLKGDGFLNPQRRIPEGEMKHQGQAICVQILEPRLIASTRWMRPPAGNQLLPPLFFSSHPRTAPIRSTAIC
jgi:hypothetical protein